MGKLKEAQQQQKEKQNGDTMSVDDAIDTDKLRANSSSDNSDDDEDDDLISPSKKKKKIEKPPISLELQRLFYQLQTGAESNHQTEYQLVSPKKKKKLKEKKKKKKKKKKKS